jgi:hypothetical protein
VQNMFGFFQSIWHHITQLNQSNIITLKQGILWDQKVSCCGESIRYSALTLPTILITVQAACCHNNHCTKHTLPTVRQPKEPRTATRLLVLLAFLTQIPEQEKTLIIANTDHQRTNMIDYQHTNMQPDLTSGAIHPSPRRWWLKR